MSKGRKTKPILLWIDGKEVNSREKALTMLGITEGGLASLLWRNKGNDLFACKGHRISRRPPKPIAKPAQKELSSDPIADAILGVKEELREGREGLVRMVHAYDEAMARLRKVEDLAIAKGRKAVPASYREGAFASAENLG